MQPRVLSGIIATVLLSVHAFASDPVVPDLKLTPGVYRKKLSATKICEIKWGLDKRHVTETMKLQVFKEYKIDPARHSEFEVDHLVSRELGGADDVRNLWPESYVTKPWNAHLKDRLENHLGVDNTSPLIEAKINSTILSLPKPFRSRSLYGSDLFSLIAFSAVFDASARSRVHVPFTK